ncbi:aspartate--ammonia ligase [Chitinophaga sp. Cy-1792]|uniref:aspartate--ammonia ligase n=1 Tax=Chitinophaga sp. Cy-1792 TaxID=2608339 RepID=UPI00142448A8|nr:aspartate--ammonia ligase [Chitinophaga sp. Cy-1792]NIG55505.1 aspartate--ammonia ligase [Chitinophaga sp. Cy-1792]
MSALTKTQYPGKLLVQEQLISRIKDHFSAALCEALCLTKVNAPLFVQSGTGLNDDLNGVERPVRFNLKGIDHHVEIVHSLAKWKRRRLYELGIQPGEGIVTDMRAIRADEEISPVHSFYVDQWDWEKSIRQEERNLVTLRDTVTAIYDSVRSANTMLREHQDSILELPEELTFIHSEVLLTLYPELTPKERENRIAREHGAVFIFGIGGPLSNDLVHDDRAPDYDDWTTPNEDGFNGLNGDLIIWNPILDRALEISSMGIRVDATALRRQLGMKGCSERAGLDFHHNILENVYPLSMGGGIGQSRLCMLLLQKQHISEVQASIWPDEHQ